MKATPVLALNNHLKVGWGGRVFRTAMLWIYFKLPFCLGTGPIYFKLPFCLGTRPLFMTKQFLFVLLI